MSDGGSGIGIPIVDVFAEIGHRRIDLLKIDIEGAEYDIMADPRFEALPVNAIIMEWHDRGPGRNLEWCMRRLAAIGFKPEAYATEPHAGMVWAPRSS